MIEVDDSELTPEYRAFLHKWANAVHVSVEVLLGRILISAIEGDLYCEKVPLEWPD